jgi:hypothetical protein
MFGFIGMIAPQLLNALNGSTASTLTQTSATVVIDGIRTALIVCQYLGQYMDISVGHVQKEIETKLNQK